MKFFFWYFFFYSFLCFECLSADIVYVQGVNTPIRETASPSGKILTQVPRGEKLEKLEGTTMWSKVRYQNIEGWVSSLMISPKSPIIKPSVMESSEDISKNARKRASAANTAGAARGLKESSSETLITIKGGNYQDLKKIYQNYVQPTSAINFIKL